MIGGENRITSNLYSFKDLFNMAIAPLNEDEFYKEISKDQLPNSICFTFELVSPYHQIVTPYPITKLYLIGARYLGEDTDNLKKSHKTVFILMFSKFCYQFTLFLMKKGLVIGGTGTMGQYLCPMLAKKGYEVHAIAGKIKNDRPGIRYFFANCDGWR